MNDSREHSYLQQVLRLDPRSDAAAILRSRRDFLEHVEPSIAEAACDESDEQDLREQMLDRFQAVRRDFWTLSADELARQLSILQKAPFADIRFVTIRLQQVALQREKVDCLLREPTLPPVFLKAFATILIAPAAEAIRLRESLLGQMRPEQNPQYEIARNAIQGSVRFIQEQYPEVFQLEEAWLLELLQFNPKEEAEHRRSNFLVGIAEFVGITLRLFIIACLGPWNLS